VIYFYPAALTPGCTTEAVDFSAAAANYAQAGYRIVGISPDQPAKLARFVQQKNLTITLLADPDKATIAAYGAWGERTLYGKLVTGVIRSTVVVELAPDGSATVVLAQYNVRATGHVGRLTSQLGLVASD
jgi:peroxiredoxin Q/BCP